MKRPFILTGTACLLLSAICLYCNIILFSVIFGFLLLLSLVVFIAFIGKSYKNSNVYIAFAVCIIFAVSAICSINTATKQTSLLSKTTGELDAIVISEPEKRDSALIYTLQGTHSLTDDSLKCELLSYDSRFQIGDRVKLTIECEDLNEKYKFQSLADGIFVTAKIKSVLSLENRASPFYTLLGRLRSFIKNSILKSVDGDRGGVLTALLTGDRAYISEELYDNTKDCGVTHIMVVSGLHVAILSGALFKVFNKLRLRKRYSVLILSVACLIIIAICNFHISAIRSVIMSLIMLSGPLIGRRSDPLNSLGFSITLIAIFNPFIAGSVSFLLSVFATFGVVYLSPKINLLLGHFKPTGFFKRLLNLSINTLSVSFSATVCILPITVFYFESVSLISPLVNLLVGFAVEIALILTSLGVFTAALPLVKILSVPIIQTSGLLAEYLIRIINLFSSFSGTLLKTEPEAANLCFLLCAAFITTVSILCKLKKSIERKNEIAAERKDPQKLT